MVCRRKLVKIVARAILASHRFSLIAISENVGGHCHGVTATASRRAGRRRVLWLNTNSLGDKAGERLDERSHRGHSAIGDNAMPMAEFVPLLRPARMGGRRRRG